MEPVFQAHPIPQNVTNFEFHLVGDMTLKQFGYLAAGLGLAFLVFTTLASVQPIIAWPIIIISALLGVAFAFLPIQDRPLDHWAAAFFRAIFKPTALKYSSKIINPQDPLFNRRLGHYIKTYKYNEARKSAPLGNPNLFPSTLTTGTVPAAVQGKAAGPALKKQNFIDKFKAGQTSFAAPEAQGTGTKGQVLRESQSQKPNTPAPTTTASAAVNPVTTPPQISPLPPTSLQSTLSVAPPIAPAAAPVPLPPLQTTSPTPGILRNMEVINKLPSTPGPSSGPQTIPTAPPAKPEEVLKPDEIKKTVELAHQAQETQQEIVKIETSLSQIKQQAAQPGVDPKTYIEQFQDLLSELQKLNEKASKTAQELAEVSKVAPHPLQPVDVIVQNAEPIKAKSIPTLKLTGFPNVINGIVTDSVGNYIEGAIVVAHDKQGLPVRALKSNKLGQFVAATPLPNGQYSIVVEKDSLSFDKIGIELNNEILPPILVAAKKTVAAA
jgi:hypothetical protein